MVNQQSDRTIHTIIRNLYHIYLGCEERRDKTKLCNPSFRHQCCYIKQNSAPEKSKL